MNHWLEILQAIKDIGLGICAFGLCAWMVVFIVKRLTVKIDSSTENIREMTSSLKTFMLMVKTEHNAQMKKTEELCEENRQDHRDFAEQNREITSALGRVNGWVDKKEGGTE